MISRVSTNTCKVPASIQDIVADRNNIYSCIWIRIPGVGYSSAYVNCRKTFPVSDGIECIKLSANVNQVSGNGHSGNIAIRPGVPGSSNSRSSINRG